MEQKVADRIVVLTAGVGMFLSTLDTGIINVALPTLSQTFHTSVSVVAWTVMLYTLALTGTIMIFGRLSDKYGRLKIYASGLILFFVASILCGISTSTGELIAFRALQGIGAAMLQGTATAIITTAIPKNRQGAAFGTLGVLLGLGPVLGPSIGGILISLGSWRWIFWINVPIALAGLAGCAFLAKGIKETKHAVRIDLPGNLLLSFAILGLLQGVTAWPKEGLFHISTAVPLVGFVVLFGLFILWELRAEQPIVDLRLFRRGAFTAPILAIFVFGGSTSLGFIVPPYFLEHVTHLAPWEVGLVNLSAPLGLVLLSKVSGQFLSKTGATRLMSIGLVIMIVAYGILGTMQQTWSPILIAILLLIYGIGGGVFLPANTSAVMGSVGQDLQGTIGSVQRMVQNLGIALYTAITAALIRSSSQTGIKTLMSGSREAWIFAAVTLALSLVIFILVHKRSRRVSKV